MIMAGMEFKQERTSLNMYISREWSGISKAGKMSKSLGNSPDLL
jgi:hypothetical protein